MAPLIHETKIFDKVLNLCSIEIVQIKCYERNKNQPFIAIERRISYDMIHLTSLSQLFSQTEPLSSRNVATDVIYDSSYV